MYSKKEISQTKRDFWTTFGLYMKPVPSAEGVKVNWKNYKTGLKNVFFRMEAGREYASIGIEITHADPLNRLLTFEQFRQHKALLEQELGEKWHWIPEDDGEYGGPFISKILKQRYGVSVMEKKFWPDIISFLKPRIIALDSFWANAKYGFEDLS